MNITRSADCDNSPKNRLLAEIEIAIAEGDTGFLRSVVTTDVRWTLVGQRTIEGLDAFLEALQALRQQRPWGELAIRHAISHGRAGAVSGVRTGVDGRVYEFCTVYEFSSIKGNAVQTIDHFAIESVGSLDN